MDPTRMQKELDNTLTGYFQYKKIQDATDALNARLAETKLTEDSPPLQIRHCALCTIPIHPDDVKCCGKCHRRAYCCRECQAKDWKSTGKGQRHKIWCGMDYGEEDIDWEVATIEGKGRGLVAKRFIPAKSRILVEGIGEFSPETYDKTKPSFLRAQLTNHACDGNAFRFPLTDDWLKAFTFHSNRDIQKGEEICTTYIYFNETACSMCETVGIKSIRDTASILKTKHKFTCPPQCICRNEEMVKLVEDTRELDALIETVLRPSTDVMKQLHIHVDLEIVKLMLQNHSRLRGSITDKARILMHRFNIAVQHPTTLKIAKEAIREVYDIYSSIFHPDCEFVQRHHKWVKDIKAHPNYLKLKDKVFGPAPPSINMAHFKKPA